MRSPAILLVLFAFACQSAPAPAPQSQPAQARELAPPVPPGVVDEGALDRTVDPCQDFYQFACGTWMQKTPIPPDRSMWSRTFSEIQERNLEILRKILEDAAAGKGSPEDPYTQKIADFYAACMDEAQAETASLETLRQELARIDAVKDAKGLAGLTGALHLKQVDALFDFDSQQDFKDATQVIGAADQGGIGLPDRDYYLKDDEKSKQIRAQYEEHVAKMLGLLGAPAKEAAAQARTVMQIETALARASMPRVDRRDPYKIYHRLERAGLEKQAPRFVWEAYFSALGYPKVTAINVVAPAFFAGLNDVLGKTRLADLKTYLRWHTLHAAAPALGKKFVEEDFRFRSAALTGEKELLPRWKRCVGAVDHALGEALARPFVKRTFGAEGKETALAMIRAIEAAFEQNLGTLSWMDAATRTQALDKLHRIVNKIGYPDTWRNYDALVVDRKSDLANRARAAEFESRRQLDKIGKPVDRGEWLLSPPTVNAYYNPSLNEMVFPAGILQPPFFVRDAGPATNYGAIGMVMGHELTHGFDDEGRQFDGAGNLRDWWSKETGQAFTDRAECVARQYDAFTILDNQHVNGKLTLGENIADIGGLKMSYAAWKAGTRGRPEGPRVAGFTEEQQLFIAYAQGWCTNRREQLSRMRLIVDPHAPPEHRVNGPLMNMPEFQAAFQCKAGSRMVPASRCAVW